MKKSESLEFFLRLIKQKHKLLISNFGQMLKDLAGEDIEKKKASAEAMLQTANDLRAVIANEDSPPWLDSTIQTLTFYINGKWNGFALLNNLIPIKNQVETHTWVFDGRSEIAFDFDSIYEHFKKESRLPELFDEIVRILEEIESSGQVDSFTMISSLKKVINIIKRGKDGSYFSLNCSWNFLQCFLKNYMWGELSKLPVLGTVMEALEKTIDEADDEMSKLHQQMQDEMKRVVESEVKALKDKSQFQFITYTKSKIL